MKDTAFNPSFNLSFITGPFTTALMTGLTYAAIVTAVFTSLNNVAKAETLTSDQFPVSTTPWFAMAVDAKDLKHLPATAAGQSYAEKPAPISDGQASQLYSQLQQNVSAQLAKQLEKEFNRKLEAATH